MFPRAFLVCLSRAVVLSFIATSAVHPVSAEFLAPFLNDFLQHLWIMPTAPAAPQPMAATHLFTQTASAAMLSHEGLILEDVPPFTQYTAFSNKGPSVGQHDNMEFMSGAFSNEDGAWLGLPQAALMGKVEGRYTVLLVQLGQPVYVPSEAKVTYTAGRVLPADLQSLALSNGALNKLLEGREGEASPAFMSIEDAQEGFLMSECSVFIDAAYTEAQPAPKPARRWLQARSSEESAPAPAPSSSSGPPPLPSWFAPGGPGNPVGLANPTLRRGGSTIPGYAVQQPPRSTAATSQQASSSPGSTEISSSDSFAGVLLVPAPAPGPGGAPRFLRLFAPAPAPLSVPALAPQVVSADPGNPVLCMTTAGPANCGRAAFGGVGSLGGPNQNGGVMASSGWLSNGHDIETTPSSPGGNAYSVNRYQPRGGVWGPYHGVNGRTGK